MDRIFFNGRIVTVDRDNPDPEAVLVRDDRIVAVGSLEKIEADADAEAERYDLEGRCLIPGFNDNHIHAAQLGRRRTWPELLDLTADQIIETLKEFRKDHPDDEILIGSGWDYTYCPNPHRSLLDEHFPDLGVFLFQFSGHGMWTNTKGLELMGFLKSSGKKKKNSLEEIMRDENGSPTGVVREAGKNKYIRRKFRKQMVSYEVNRICLSSALEELATAGITSVQDNTWIKKPLLVLRDLQNEEKLTCRFSCWPLGEIPHMRLWMSTAKLDENWYHLGPIKYFLDGAFSSHTAWLYEEYEDEPGNSGKGIPVSHIKKHLSKHVKKRRQVAHHGIGDRAISEFCTAVEELTEKYPWIDNLRLRIEHGQLIKPEDIPRLKKLGILVCAQPPALIDPEKDKRLLGEERARTAYPFRSLLDAGVPLSFGSDYPGEAFFDPIRGIHLVVNREGPERITAREALECYTQGSAYAELRENEKGSITPGKLADLVVLSESIVDVPPAEIINIKVVETIVGGHTVYQAKNAGQESDVAAASRSR